VTPPACRFRRARITARAATLTVITLLAAAAGADLPALAQTQSDQTQSDSAPPAPNRATTWLARLVPDADDTNVRSDAGALRLGPGRSGPASLRGVRSEGMLLTPLHPLTALSSQVKSELTAVQPAGSAVTVDVRGTRADGSWTEWVPTRAKVPAALGAAVTAVQARIVLHGAPGGAGPQVRSVWLTAVPGVQLLAARPRDARSYRVFATREGLVGSTTANGHVIRPRDHFVALPSRQALGPRDSGDYTVKVCAATGRCEWAPVWDVGPWNTADDYWNPPGERSSWPDLPQGQPEAQAAFEDGYNGGHDQFGRPVRNQAGIDLADGTFWDGLGLRNNSWVTVTYLWTDDGAPAIVGIPVLPILSGPGQQFPPVGLAAEHARLPVECAVDGQLVHGPLGVSDRWLRIGPKQFVSAANVTVPGTSKGTSKRCPKP
jgi:hypothetical protein